VPAQKPSGKLVPRADRRSGGSGGRDCCVGRLDSVIGWGDGAVAVVFGDDGKGGWALVGVIMLVLVGLELTCFDGE